MPDAPPGNDPASPPPPPLLPLNYSTADPAAYRWKTAWRGGTVEANLAVTKLQQQGLQARIDFENTASLGANAYAPSGAAIQVIEADLPAAREILDEIELHRRQRIDADSPACPSCAAKSTRRVIHPIRKVGLIVAFVGLILSAGPPLWSVPFFLPIPLILLAIAFIFWPMLPYWKCSACGKRFHAREGEPREDDDNDDQEEDVAAANED